MVALQVVAMVGHVIGGESFTIRNPPKCNFRPSDRLNMAPGESIIRFPFFTNSRYPKVEELNLLLQNFFQFWKFDSCVFVHGYFKAS